MYILTGIPFFFKIFCKGSDNYGIFTIFAPKISIISFTTIR